MLTDVVIANKSYTRLNITEGEAVDRTALMVIKQDCPDFLLPLKTMEIDGELELRYELLEGIRLCYSAMKMKKAEFAGLMKKMLTPFKICNDWFLDYHNLLMDAGYILVGRNGQPVRYVYIPAPGYAQSDAEIIDFFCSLILKAEIEDDPRYAMNLLRILKGDNANLITLLDYISKEGDAGAAEGEQPTSGQSVPMQPESGQSAPEQPAFRQQDNRQTASVHRFSIPFGGARETADEQPASPKGQTPAAEEQRQGLSAAAVRPGQTPREFGKQDIEGQLLGSLFGDDEDEKPAKGRKDKTDKKGGKTARQEKAPKEKKEGGLFLFKGKSQGGKQTASETSRSPFAAGEKASESVAAAPQQAAGPISGGWQSQSVGEEGATEIDMDEEAYDSGVVRLSLEDGAGFRCPPYIEISLQKGYATVGRMDKSGQGQSDFNFDASLSFVSRIHFRIERVGDQWQIIDLGSRNGTFLNGEALVPNMPYPLRPNDRIMISAKNRLIYRVN